MKARIRFATRPVFNYPPDRIAAPCVMVGRAEDRRMWTMCFTAQQKVSELVYVGEAQWLSAPVEHDFGKGVRFYLVSDPSLYADGPSTQGVLAEGELLG